MQLFTGLLLFLTVSSAFALPAGNPNDDAEIVPVSRRQENVGRDYETDVDPDFKDFKGVIDTGSGYPFFSLRPYNPFSIGFFDNFEDVFRRLRESLLQRWWATVPGEEDWTLDPSKGNTTSVVKVVDGHKIEINDTVYTKTDDSGNAIYKVRVVNIRPVDSSEETSTSGPNVHDNEADRGSPEVTEREPQDNEILGNIDSTEQHIESTTSEHVSLESTTQGIHHEIFKHKEFDSDESKSSDEELSTEQMEQFNEAKRDKLTTNSTTPTESEADVNIEKSNNRPDAEKTATNDNDFAESLHQPITYYEPNPQRGKYRESVEDEASEELDHITRDEEPEWNEFNNYQQEIDVYNTINADLSNDIAVNEMLADQGAPINPDAEVFSVDNFKPVYENPHYEIKPLQFEHPVNRIKFFPIRK